VLLQCVRYVVRSAFFGLERSDRDRQTTPTAAAAVTKVESGVSGCRGAANGTDGMAAPRSACVASEGVRQTGIAEEAAVTQEVRSAEEAQVVERPGTSEMEVDSVGDKETAESERPLICPSDSDEKQTGERVECVPMADETQSDKVSDIATTTTDEATAAGVDKVSDVSTTTADESGVDKVSDVATTTSDEATAAEVDKLSDVATTTADEATAAGGDKVSDVSTTTADEATLTGVDKVSDVATTTADEATPPGVDKVSDVATTTADEATPTGVYDDEIWEY